MTGYLLLWAALLMSSSSALSLGDGSHSTTGVTRRGWFQQTAGASLAAATTAPSATLAAQGPHLLPEAYQSAAQAPSKGRRYFPTLTPPFLHRATYRYDLGRHAWAFEQLLAFANVTATIRSNVIELQNGGGLWVHSPQWPTGEFLELLDELNQPVKHIVLPCNALEHKAPMSDFCKRFPKATVWISPGQYGPFGACGLSMKDKVSMPYRVDGILGSGESPPWADEFDIATLYVDLPENAGPVSEAAFFHRPTRTLVATDAVVYIPGGKAPDIFSTYFNDEAMQDSTFWPRSVLQAVFLPLRQDDNGGYPAFSAIQDRLVRAPILRAFADARAPEAVEEWTQKIAAWDFDRIITSHFSSPIAATPADFSAADAYLDAAKAKASTALPPIACQDWELLDGLNNVIAENKLGAPAVYDYTVGCLKE